MTSEQDFKSFFIKQRNEIATVQKKIIVSALFESFERSPHIGSARFAKSEYDANHKISINNGPASPHHGPTFNAGISKTLVDAEAIKAQNIKCGDTVLVFNTTMHDLDVEVGPLPGNFWARDGYYVHEHARIAIMGRYANVLK